MNTIELQNNIIRKILNTKDNQLLRYLNSLLTKGVNSNIYQLSDFEREIIKESLTDYKNESVISNDNVFSKTEKLAQ